MQVPLTLAGLSCALPGSVSVDVELVTQATLHLAIYR